MRVIALDIGGTKIEGAVFGLHYRKAGSVRIASPAGLPRKDALSAITGLIDRLWTKNTAAIGISYPCFVPADGVIPGISKIRGLAGFNLGRYLGKKYRVPVAVANDADCFAMGEHAMGAAKGTSNCFGLIWGTGVGGGLVLGSRLYTSSFGSAAEVGHIVVDPKGPANPFGVRGDIEAFAGGASIARNYRAAGGRQDADAKTIAKSNDPIARQVMQQAIEKIALLCSHVQNTFDPEIIVVGGGLSHLKVYATLNRLARSYTFPPLAPHLRIVRNRLGDSAGTYGAAALAFNSRT